MPLDEAADERAIRQHAPAARPRLVEHLPNQLGGKAPPFECRVDLGVQESARQLVVVVLDETGALIVDPDLDPALFCVVLDHSVRHDSRVGVTVDDVRALATSLPRTTEHLIYDRVKFRIGRIVYIAFSRDEQFMGFAFPKEERAALVASEPSKFELPRTSDMRYNWVVARLDALSTQEMHELVVDAWQMCVPKRVAREHLGVF
jgi:hypothetical protein